MNAKTLLTAYLFFLSTLAHTQPITYTTASPCPATITLYPNATYTYTTGCEPSPLLTFGSYTIKKDTVILRPADLKTYSPIQSVVADSMAGNTITVTVLDNEGRNATGKISIGLEVPGRGSYMLTPDSSGSKTVYNRAGGRLVLRTLNKLFGQSFSYATDTANHFVITLNLSAGWLSSSHAGWGGGGTIRLLKKGATLVVLWPQSPAVFTVQPGSSGIK